MPTSPKDYSAVACQYAEDVVAGRIPACEWTRRACQRSLRDWDQEDDPLFPYRYDPRAVHRVCSFIERLCHVKNIEGTIRLEPWQCWVLSQPFGWVEKAGERQGKRRFRKVYLEVPRSNAKSTLSSGVGLYMLSDGENGAEVYSAATTRDQARIVFEDAQRMARKPRSRALMDYFDIRTTARDIRVPRTGSRFLALSADANTLDGLNIYCAIIDELHAHRTRAVWDVLVTGAGKRDQSLIWAITTAGFDLTGICYEQRTYLTKILEGVVTDDTVFGSIWTIDEGDDWREPESWQKANPNWNVSVKPKHVEGECRQAEVMASAQNNFLTKHLNEWVNAETRWLTADAIAACEDNTLKLEDFRGKQCWIGVDAAQVNDLFAKVLLFPEMRQDRLHVTAFCSFYTNRETMRQGRNASYSGFQREGWLTVHNRATTDFDAITDDIRRDCELYQVEEIAYDPWRMEHHAQRLFEEGFPMIAVRKTTKTFSLPMQELETMILDGRFHFNNPVLRWMFTNTIVTLDRFENRLSDKERPENKIDGVDATITGLARLILNDFSADFTPLITILRR